MTKKEPKIFIKREQIIQAAVLSELKWDLCPFEENEKAAFKANARNGGKLFYRWQFIEPPRQLHLPFARPEKFTFQLCAGDTMDCRFLESTH
jgi:hypothetical protein